MDDSLPDWAMSLGRELMIAAFHGEINALDIAKELATVRKTALLKVADGLAPLYEKDRVAIARLCDEVMDPTGNLLGWVRQAAMKNAPVRA
jgi:hypothetical protein